eukprot:g18479.t1
MRAGASSTTLAALAVASLAGNSAAFIAPCITSSSSSSSSSSFLRKSLDAVHAASTASTATMSLEGNTNAARVALGTFLAGAAIAFSGGEAALADGSTAKFSLPPISQAKDRCAFKSSAMGQANAARDKLYDLRECDMSGKSAAGFDLSGVIASEANFAKTDFKEVVMSKAYARSSNWDLADFTNAVVDRVSFDGSSMKGAIFQNAVLTSTSFTGADVENADFTEAYLGDFDQKNLCKNPTLKGTNPVTNADTRDSAGYKARNTRTLLEMPTKVTNIQGMSRPDQIAIGKAIVDRPGKDDFWVTNSTAGWTFAAATREVPEDFPIRVDVGRLRKVSRGVSRERNLCSRQTRGISGLLGTRELALLESQYRMAEAECRAENTGGWSSADPRGDRRYRRPKPAKGEYPTGSAAAGLEDGDVSSCEADHSEEDDFVSGPASSKVTGGAGRSGGGGDQAEARTRGYKLAVNVRLPSAEVNGRVGSAPAAYGFDDEFPTLGGAPKWPSTRYPAARPQTSPSRPDPAATRHTATGTASPPKPGQGDRGSRGRRDADDDSPTEVRGGRLTAQPLNIGRTGTPRRKGCDEANRGAAGMGGAVKLHKGVVITDELRKELLNPLAHHRFKLLRGAN